jgi:hypothetical protein
MSEAGAFGGQKCWPSSEMSRCRAPGRWPEYRARPVRLSDARTGQMHQEFTTYVRNNYQRNERKLLIAALT